MNQFSVTLLYIAFFSLIGFTVFFTESAWPLFALIFTPSYSSGDDDE
jgi:hypothetical protein